MNKYILYKWKIVSLIILIGLLSSCSLHIEKRRYRPGFYVEQSTRTQGKHIDKTISTVFEQIKLIHADPIESSIHLVAPEPLMQVEERKVILPKRSEPLIKALKRRSECDIIYLKNGTTLEVTALKIDEDKVTYRNCGNNHSPEGPIYNNQIKKIKLANGSEVIPSKEMGNIRRTKARDGEDKKEKGAVSATSVVAWVFGGIAIGLAVIGIILFATAFNGGFAGIINGIIGGILLLIALIFMIIAIVIGSSRRR